MAHHSRRTIVRAGAAAGGLVLAGPWLGISTSTALARSMCTEASAAQGIRASDFRFAIHGLTSNLVGIRSITGGKLTIDVKVDPSKEPGQQLYYGDHTWEDITLTVQTGVGMIKLQEWCDMTMASGGRANALARDCSLYLARDKSTVIRTINYFGCYPTSCNEDDHSTDSEIKTMTVTMNVARIEETKG